MVSLHDEIRKRYLSYAMSVIMERALPDVRDGLKPVQRRILYSMWQDLRLGPKAKYRKNAAIVGRCMSAYHPHGDASIADALVRMAQDFSLRYPLVDGHGNYGSIDGDGAAAMRYIEARLTGIATKLLEELREGTVDLRPNYDGTVEEPTILPAQVPNLLVNGAAGIAVGMATNIPPHNLTETVKAAIALIDSPETDTAALIQSFIKGPDFPTGGIILEDEDAVIAAYEEGRGTFTIRSRWEKEGDAIVFTEIPYGVRKDALLLKIAQEVEAGEIPQIEDIVDESGEDEIRIVAYLKRGTEHEAVLAYLFRHTDLEKKFHLNLTCLVPSKNHDIPVPAQIGIRRALQEFLTFRFEVVTRRLEQQKRKLKERVHILEAFVAVFSDLQRAVTLIQASGSKADARARVEQAFGLTTRQAEAIITIPLYRLANTEKEAVEEELRDKAALLREVERVLTQDAEIWRQVRLELEAVLEEYGDERRTSVGEKVLELEYKEEDFIEEVDVALITSRLGWVRTQKSYSSVESLRCREGDEIGWALETNTKESVLFFTNKGKCYTARVDDIPMTTGYGTPLQGIFDFEDGEFVVAVFTESDVTDCELISITEGGLASRFSATPFVEPSTVVGRTYHRIEDAVVNVCVRKEGDYVVLATKGGRGITFDAEEVRLYKGAGKGVRAVRVGEGDAVLAFATSGPRNDSYMVVETNRGALREITYKTYSPRGRGGKGYYVIKRGHLVKWVRAVEEQ